jgi:hypothetical protein
MENRNQNPDLFVAERKELPGMLNVLTILTFIGCALSYMGALWSFVGKDNYDEQMRELEEAVDKAPNNTLRNIAESSMEMFQKTYEYRYLLLAVGLVCTTLCLIGAIQMRRLKKSGFTIYVIGELAPLAVSAAVIGFGSLMGEITLIISTVFAVLFVILYGTQRKYLVN